MGFHYGVMTARKIRDYCRSHSEYDLSKNLPIDFQTPVFYGHCGVLRFGFEPYSGS